MASPTTSCEFLVLAQFAYRVPDALVHKLSIGNGVSHDGIPMQSHIGGAVFAFQHKCLQAPLLSKGVVRGIAEKLVHSLLPYASLYSVDDGGHASVKFARHINRKRIFFHHGSF